MMEFITSRATMVICGIVLLAVIAVPLSNVYSQDESNRIEDLALSDAKAYDALCDSGMDEIFLNGSVFLPSSSYNLYMKGNVLTITTSEGKHYTTAIAHACEDLTLSYGESIILVKNERGYSLSAEGL